MSTPQFQRRAHRAKRALDAVAHSYPGAWGAFDRLRRQRGSEPDFDWPDWCYMPIAGGYAVASDGGRLPLELAHHPAIITALGTWRMTQGIYRFDPALFSAVLDTPIDGDIPAAHLQHLPEWCVYVDLSGADIDPRLHGAWLHMEYDVARGGQAEFRVVFDCAADPRQPFAAAGLEPLAVPLVGSIDDSLAHLARSADYQSTLAGHPLGAAEHAAIRGQREIVRGMLALALYLCSESPDITRRGQPGTPVNPAPVRSRSQGWAIHPADGPREWDVGVRIGAALRGAYAREQTGGEAAATGRHVRPHVRRAHWHTILSGARKRDDGTAIPTAERRSELRWMPPIPVAVDDIDALPAVVHRVRP